jgi:hypothetical protein
VNVNEAKNILLLYRPGTADAEDPQIATALALAKMDPELARWLELHCARQFVISQKFRQIAVPAGLKEQIISEQAARGRPIFRRPHLALAAAMVLLVCLVAMLWLPRQPKDDTLAVYQHQMAGIALRGYGMDLTTNDSAQIRAYFAQKQSPADYVLSGPLQKAVVVGCAVEGWRNVKVSMICFRTGHPLPANQSSDLWLFVVDRASVKDAPEISQLQFSVVNQLNTAVWVMDGKIYLLGAVGDEATLRKFL